MPDDNIFIAGAGSSNLVIWFQKNNFINLYVNDISKVALGKLEARLDGKKSIPHWVLGDLRDSNIFKSVPKVKLWHDRGVQHFFLTKKEQDVYYAGIRNIVVKGGFVIIAAFSMEGAEVCSGLPVYPFTRGSGSTTAPG